MEASYYLPFSFHVLLISTGRILVMTDASPRLLSSLHPVGGFASHQYLHVSQKEEIYAGDFGAELGL